MPSRFTIENCTIISQNLLNLKNHCTICRSNINHPYENNKMTDHQIITGICQHSFHKKCLIPWIINNPICPICCKEWLPQ